jgi:serine/threonine-protein kinase
MPVDDALEILDAVAEALDYAHGKGLLHRDVKPANILLATPDNGRRRILLTDFGIARQTDEISGLTATNMTIGTVSYASPEQLTGKQVDGRSDQYSLAVTIYELLTGAKPFEHSNPAVVIGMHLSEEPPRMGDARPTLAAADITFARALSKQPAARFPTCRDFASALRIALTDTDIRPSVKVQQATAADHPRTSCRRTNRKPLSRRNRMGRAGGL